MGSVLTQSPRKTTPNLDSDMFSNVPSQEDEKPSWTVLAPSPCVEDGASSDGGEDQLLEDNAISAPQGYRSSNQDSHLPLPPGVLYGNAQTISHSPLMDFQDPNKMMTSVSTAPSYTAQPPPKLNLGTAHPVRHSNSGLQTLPQSSLNNQPTSGNPLYPKPRKNQLNEMGLQSMVAETNKESSSLAPVVDVIQPPTPVPASTTTTRVTQPSADLTKKKHDAIAKILFIPPKKQNRPKLSSGPPRSSTTTVPASASTLPQLPPVSRPVSVSVRGEVNGAAREPRKDNGGSAQVARESNPTPQFNMKPTLASVPATRQEPSTLRSASRNEDVSERKRDVLASMTMPPARTPFSFSPFNTNTSPISPRAFAATPEKRVSVPPASANTPVKRTVTPFGLPLRPPITPDKACPPVGGPTSTVADVTPQVIDTSTRVKTMSTERKEVVPAAAASPTKILSTSSSFNMNANPPSHLLPPRPAPYVPEKLPKGQTLTRPSLTLASPAKHTVIPHGFQSVFRVDFTGTPAAVNTDAIQNGPTRVKATNVEGRVSTAIQAMARARVSSLTPNNIGTMNPPTVSKQASTQAPTSTQVPAPIVPNGNPSSLVLPSAPGTRPDAPKQRESVKNPVLHRSVPAASVNSEEKINTTTQAASPTQVPSSALINVGTTNLPTTRAPPSTQISAPDTRDDKLGSLALPSVPKPATPATRPNTPKQCQSVKNSIQVPDLRVRAKSQFDGIVVPAIRPSSSAGSVVNKAPSRPSSANTSTSTSTNRKKKSLISDFFGVQPADLLLCSSDFVPTTNGGRRAESKDEGKVIDISSDDEEDEIELTYPEPKKEGPVVVNAAELQRERATKLANKSKANESAHGLAKGKAKAESERVDVKATKVMVQTMNRVTEFNNVLNVEKAGKGKKRAAFDLEGGDKSKPGTPGLSVAADMPAVTSRLRARPAPVDVSTLLDAEVLPGRFNRKYAPEYYKHHAQARAELDWNLRHIRRMAAEWRARNEEEKRREEEREREDDRCILAGEIPVERGRKRKRERWEALPIGIFEESSTEMYIQNVRESYGVGSKLWLEANKDKTNANVNLGASAEVASGSSTGSGTALGNAKSRRESVEEEEEGQAKKVKRE